MIGINLFKRDDGRATIGVDFHHHRAQAGVADVQPLAGSEGSVDEPGVKNAAIAAIEPDGVYPDFRRFDNAGNPSETTIVMPPPIKAANVAAAFVTLAAKD